jgi:MarR family transcriptional regulator for hemolysin
VNTTCGVPNDGREPGLEQRFSTALHNSARVWRQALDRRLKHLGLGQASWMAIASIAKFGHPPSQTELAAQLGVEDPTMVSMLDRLSKAGFVTRQPSETDRRVKQVYLTEAGKDIYRTVMDVAASFRVEMLAGVDAEKLRVVTDFLETIQATTESIL